MPFDRSLTLDHTQCGGSNTTDFPYLFSGTFAYLATVANGGKVESSLGYDIVFCTDPTNPLGSKLDFERVVWIATTGACEFWIRVPTLSHTADTVIYVYYGDAAISIDQQNKTGTWASKYAGVWHFGDGTTLDLTDSTSNANNGTNHGGSAAASLLGPGIGGSVVFSSASSQYVDIANATSLNPTTGLTLQAVIKSAVNNALQGILGKRDGTNGYQIVDHGNNIPVNTMYIGILKSGAESDAFCNASDWSDFNAHSFWGTYNNTSLAAYFNGILRNTTSVSNGLGATTTNLSFGRLPDAGLYCDDTIDEVRIANVGISADQITAEFNNITAGSTFTTIGPEQNPTPPGSLFTLAIREPIIGLTDQSSRVALGAAMAIDFTLQANSRGTASIALFVPAANAYKPTTGAPVYLSDLSTATPVCVFAGTIDSWSITYYDDQGDRIITLTCVAFEQVFDVIRVSPRAYFNKTAGFIVTDIYNTDCVGVPVDLGTIQTGPTIEVLLISWDTASSIFSQLGQAAQFITGVDPSASIGGSPNPTLYFQAPNTSVSPLTLRTDMMLWQTPQYAETRADYRNRQIVRLSYQAFAATTFSDDSPDGVLTSFDLPFPAYQVLAAGLTTSLQATVTGTFTGAPSPADTITIAARVYSWVAALDNTQRDQILIGGSAAADAANLAACINADPTLAGLTFSLPTWANDTVLADQPSTGTITIRCMIAGTAGNSVAVSESTANFTWASGTLDGGSDGVTKPLTVGVAGSSTLADLTYTPGSGTLTLAVAPPAGQILATSFQRYGSDCIAVENTADVILRAAAEDGTGKYQQLVSEVTGSDPVAGLTSAQSILAAYNTLPASLQFQTDTPGFVLGQQLAVSLINPVGLPMLVSGNWLIEEVSGSLVIPYDPRPGRTGEIGFRYTVTIINVTTQANYVQFFQRLGQTGLALGSQSPTSPNAGTGATSGQPANQTQFITEIVTADGFIPAENPAPVGVPLVVTVIQDGFGGHNITFVDADFAWNPSDTPNTSPGATTTYNFIGDANTGKWLQTAPSTTILQVPGVRQSNTFSDLVGSGTTSSLTLGNIFPGNWIVVMAVAQTNNIVTTISDTLGTVYTLIEQTSDNHGAAWIGQAPISGSPVITFTSSGGAGNFEMGAWEVQGYSGAVDASAASTSGTPPAVTTSFANSLVLFETATQFGSVTFSATAPSVLDSQATNNGSVGIGHLPTTTTGTYTPSFSNTAGGGAIWNMTVAIKVL